MIKKLLKTTLLTLTLTATLLTPTFASTNVLDDFTGWYYNKNTQVWNYYLKGEKVSNGVVSGTIKIYYLDSLGNLENGWFTKNDSTVYFQDGLLTTGWKQINGSWYYFNELGAMQTGTQNIDGKTYIFAYDGHWLG